MRAGEGSLYIDTGHPKKRGAKGPFGARPRAWMRTGCSAARHSPRRDSTSTRASSRWNCGPSPVNARPRRPVSVVGVSLDLMGHRGVEPQTSPLSGVVKRTPIIPARDRPAISGSGPRTSAALRQRVTYQSPPRAENDTAPRKSAGSRRRLAEFRKTGVQSTPAVAGDAKRRHGGHPWARGPLSSTLLRHTFGE